MSENTDYFLKKCLFKQDLQSKMRKVKMEIFNFLFYVICRIFTNDDQYSFLSVLSTKN